MLVIETQSQRDMMVRQDTMGKKVQLAQIAAAPKQDNAQTTCCGLHQLGIGCEGCVVAVGGDRDLKRRLLEMGFCNGARVEVIRRAPMGDPTEFRLRGYHLSLRDEQAKHVQIQPV
jgi:ferrous iron transport protein A